MLRQAARSQARRQRQQEEIREQLAPVEEEKETDAAERQAEEERRVKQQHADREQAARAEAKRRAHEAAQLESERKRQAARQAQKMEEEEIWKIWLGTGGPKTGPNWIRRTWPNEAKDFTPWLARNLDLVSACTELDLRLEGKEVSAAGGWADIVARDNKSKSKVVIENQLDAADFDHWRQLVFYGGILDARIRIWIAASFSPNICRNVRDQNRLSESRSGGAIYYLLKLKQDSRRPISLALGPTKTQRSFAVGDWPHV